MQFICFSRLVLRMLFFIPLVLYANKAFLQQSTTYSSLDTLQQQSHSSTEFLAKAQSVSDIDPVLSKSLVNKALKLAESNNNHLLAMQAHTLLANIAFQEKQAGLSSLHYLKVLEHLNNINDKDNHIFLAIDFIKNMWGEKYYEQGLQLINTLLPIAERNGDKYSIAQVLVVKGDGYYSQKNYQESIDSYILATSYLTNENEVIQERLGDIYKRIAQSYKRLVNREQSAFYYKKTLDVYTALNIKKSMARTLTSLAEAERYLGNYMQALDYSNRSVKMYHDLDDPIGLAKALNGAGIILRHIGRYEKSLEQIHQAYLYYQDVGDTNGMGKTSNQMGSIYTELKQFDHAQSFYQLTIDLEGEEVDRNTLASAYREMAVIYFESGGYENALNMAQKALQLYILEKDKNKEAITERIIGHIYQKQGAVSDAISHFRQSVAAATQAKNTLNIIKAQTALASLLIADNPENVIFLLKQSEKLAMEIDDIPEALYVIHLLLKAEKKLGNFKQALSYAEKQIALTKTIQAKIDEDEIILETANLHSHKMEIELQTLREKEKLHLLDIAKKNDEIEIAEQAKIITDLQLMKNKYASIALASLLVLSILLALFIYIRFVKSKKHNKELNVLAMRDPLTNCYNRRVLFDLMNKDFANLSPLDEYCVVMLDIDHFKAVNDTYGHSVGDSVLKGVANILINGVRKNDIVARYGGEEFCIVLSSADKNQAILIVEAIRKTVQEACFEDIKVTCSIGVSSIKFKAKTPRELIEQADFALLKCKALGRNQVMLWGSVE
ncbi:tetratricopeptide repeat-containing diguanylate cyclase [Paraglaciecola sp. L3A3]|uniref:tetratricopeptide repeat-containing diguanylate cyclase n=1 Tax=Paraglaciecola sp. L3A3 TaxID=2686358 RepID=UPI001E5C12C8|nr:tetratricopeptide repeat-containing diguanylate cyclase [Paraglaciecola sp. L3A3]